jgi:hypothetical protein
MKLKSLLIQKLESNRLYLYLEKRNAIWMLRLSIIFFFD